MSFLSQDSHPIFGVTNAHLCQFFDAIHTCIEFQLSSQQNISMDLASLHQPFVEHLLMSQLGDLYGLG